MKKKLLFSFALLLMSISSAFAALGEVVTTKAAFISTYKAKLQALAVVENPVASLTYNANNWATVNGAKLSADHLLELNEEITSEAELDLLLAEALITRDVLNEMHVKIVDLKNASAATEFNTTYGKTEIESYYNGTATFANGEAKTAAIAKVKAAANAFAELEAGVKEKLTWIPNQSTVVKIGGTPVKTAPRYFADVINSINAIYWLDDDQTEGIKMGFGNATVANTSTTSTAAWKARYNANNFSNEGYGGNNEWKEVTKAEALKQANRIFAMRNGVANPDTWLGTTLISNVIAWLPVFGKVNGLVAAHIIYKKEPIAFDYQEGSSDFTDFAEAYAALMTSKTLTNNDKAVINGTIPSTTLPSELYAELYGRGTLTTISACLNDLKANVDNYEIPYKFAEVYRDCRLWTDADFILYNGNTFGTKNDALAYNKVKDMPTYKQFIESHAAAKTVALDICNYNNIVNTFIPKVEHLLEAYKFFTDYNAVIKKPEAQLNVKTDYTVLKEALATINEYETTDYTTVPVLPIIAGMYPKAGGDNIENLKARIQSYLDLLKPYYFELAGKEKIVLDIVAQFKKDIQAVNAYAEPWTSDQSADLTSVWNKYNAFKTNSSTTVQAFLNAAPAGATDLVYDRTYLMDILTDDDYTAIGTGVYDSDDLADLVANLETNKDAAALFVDRTAKVNSWIENQYAECKDLEGVKENKDVLNAAYAVYTAWVAKNADPDLKNFYFWTGDTKSAKTFYTAYVAPIKTLNDKANADDLAYKAATKWIEIATEIMNNDAVYSAALVEKIDAADVLYNNTGNNATTGKLAATGRAYVEESAFDMDAYAEFCENVKADYIGTTVATSYFFTEKNGLKNKTASLKYGAGSAVEGQEMSWTAFETYANELHKTNPNAITYINAKTDRVLPVNVIAKNMSNKIVASEIELTDGEPFYLTQNVTNVEKLTLKKNFRDNSNLANFFVPFAVDETNLKALMDDGYKFGYLTTAVETDGVDGKKNVDLKFRLKKDGDHLAANMPYVVIAPKAGNVDIELSNVSLAKYNANAARITCASTSANYTLKGLYCQTAVERGDKNWMLSNSSSFIYLASSDENPTIKRNAGTLVFEIEAKNDNIDYVVRMDLDDEATGIETIATDAENQNAIYTINGVKVKNMSKAGIYVVNGKKFVVK